MNCLNWAWWKWVMLIAVVIVLSFMYCEVAKAEDLKYDIITYADANEYAEMVDSVLQCHIVKFDTVDGGSSTELICRERVWVDIIKHPMFRGGWPGGGQMIRGQAVIWWREVTK